VTHLFLEHKARKECNSLFDGEVIKSSVEDHFREEQLVTGANLTGHTTFHVNYIRGGGETKSGGRKGRFRESANNKTNIKAS